MYTDKEFMKYERAGRIVKKSEKYKKKRKTIISILLTIFITLAIIIFNPTFVLTRDNNVDEEGIQSVKGKAVRIISSQVKEAADINENIDRDSALNKEAEIISQQIEVLITNGKHKGDMIIVESNYDKSVPYSFEVKKGDKLFVSIEENENGKITEGYIYEYGRDKYIIYLVVIFVLAMILIGGKTGIKSLITLSFTAFGVIKVLPTLLLKGYNPVITSIMISIIIIILTLTIVSGINKKTAAAVIGTIGGVLIAGIIALIIGNLSKLTGFGNEEAQMLMYIPQKVNFDYKGLLFAGIIMGALGAVMDVSMSIASSMNEIEAANPKISTPELIKSGMSVGRDIMGTMSNTLILAYVGASLHLIILIMAWNTSLVEIINTDMMASEIVRAMAGSIGLIFSIPITALVSGMIRKY